MTDTKQKPPSTNDVPSKDAAGATPPATAFSTWERLADDWRKNPKKWLSWLVTVTIVVTAGILALSYFSRKSEEAAASISSDLLKALNEQKASERAARLKDLLNSVAGKPQEAMVTFLYARASREAADEAEVPADKIRLYRDAIDAAKGFTTRFSGNPIATMPWRAPGTPGVTTNLSLVQRLLEYSEKQVAWLNGRTVDTAEKADVNAKGTIVLADPEGKEHSLELRFFSKDAPYAVDIFFAMARDGVFDGMHVYGVEQQDPNTDDNHAAILGSAFSKLAPERSDLYGSEKDYIGFTIPRDDSRIKPKKGRLAFDIRREGGYSIVGQNPISLVLYLMDPRNNQDRAIFAEVAGEPEVLAALGKVKATSKDKPINPASRIFLAEKPWKITKVSVEGQPEHPPAAPLARQLKMPEVPSKEDPKPDGPK